MGTLVILLVDGEKKLFKGKDLEYEINNGFLVVYDKKEHHFRMNAIESFDYHYE